MRLKLAIVLAAGSCTVPLAHGAFLPDTISVVRVGDGSLPLTGGVAQSAYVLTYDAQTGSLLNTVPLTGTVLPSKDDGADGHLSFTGNGQYLTLGGYTAAAGSSDPVAAAVPRAVVRVDGAGNVATSGLSGVYVGKSVVAVASPDGNSFFIAGENTTAGSGGLRYLPSLASTTTVNVSRTQTGSNADAFRNLRVVNGQLYANTASQGSFTNRGVYAMTIGGGLPVAATNTPSVASPSSSIPKGISLTPTATSAPTPLASSTLRPTPPSSTSTTTAPSTSPTPPAARRTSKSGSAPAPTGSAPKRSTPPPSTSPARATTRSTRSTTPSLPPASSSSSATTSASGSSPTRAASACSPPPTSPATRTATSAVISPPTTSSPPGPMSSSAAWRSSSPSRPPIPS